MRFDIPPVGSMKRNRAEWLRAKAVATSTGAGGSNRTNKSSGTELVACVATFVILRAAIAAKSRSLLSIIAKL
jgi:hypothetical protein